MTTQHRSAFFLILMTLCLGLSCATTPEPIDRPYSEYSPTISADGRTLIFQADIEKRGTYRIYQRHRVLDRWTESAPLASVNSEFNDGGCFITYDQNALLLTSNRPGGRGGTDIWISRRMGDSWSAPQNLGAPINSSGYDGFASLSPDGRTIYFVRDCPEKKKCSGDRLGIYYAEKNPNGDWQEPKKMPEPVNSDYCEFGPIIQSDGSTLIFSSSRPGGSGGYDLYKTEKQEDGTWSEPVNLGEFVNTRGEDSLVSIPASGDVMYYTRAMNPDQTEKRKHNARRIYTVPIPENLQNSKVIVVRGTVRDKRDEEKTLHAQIAITDIKKDDIPVTLSSNEHDGNYIAILNKGKAWDFAVSSPGYFFHSEKIDLTNLKQFREVNQDIFLEPIVVGAHIVLNNMFFETRSYKLLKDSKHELNRIITIMKENPTMKVEISGHTDNVGTARYNMVLSRRRAESVVAYLTENGVEAERLVAKGYGFTKPKERNIDERSRRLNRRVEIQVLAL